MPFVKRAFILQVITKDKLITFAHLIYNNGDG